MFYTSDQEQKAIISKREVSATLFTKQMKKDIFHFTIRFIGIRKLSMGINL